MPRNSNTVGTSTSTSTSTKYYYLVWDKVPEGSTLIFGDTRLPLNTVGYAKRTSVPKTSLIRAAVLTEYRLVGDGQTDTGP